MHLLVVARCIEYVKNCMRGNRDNLSFVFESFYLTKLLENGILRQSRMFKLFKNVCTVQKIFHLNGFICFKETSTMVLLSIPKYLNGSCLNSNHNKHTHKNKTTL